MLKGVLSTIFTKLPEEIFLAIINLTLVNVVSANLCGLSANVLAFYITCCYFTIQVNIKNRTRVFKQKSSSIYQNIHYYSYIQKIIDLKNVYKFLGFIKQQQHILLTCLIQLIITGRVKILEDIQIMEPHCRKKMKFSIKDFFSKCDEIRSFLRIWLHLLKKSLMENFLFCAVPSKFWIHITHQFRKSKDSRDQC